MAQYNIIALRSSGHQHHCVRCIFGAVTVKVNLQFHAEIKEMYLSAFQFHILFVSFLSRSQFHQYQLKV